MARSKMTMRGKRSYAPGRRYISFEQYLGTQQFAEKFGGAAWVDRPNPGEITIYIPASDSVGDVALAGQMWMQIIPPIDGRYVGIMGEGDAQVHKFVIWPVSWRDDHPAGEREDWRRTIERYAIQHTLFEKEIPWPYLAAFFGHVHVTEPVSLNDVYSGNVDLVAVAHDAFCEHVMRTMALAPVERAALHQAVERAADGDEEYREMLRGLYAAASTALVHRNGWSREGEKAQDRIMEIIQALDKETLPF